MFLKTDTSLVERTRKVVGMHCTFFPCLILRNLKGRYLIQEISACSLAIWLLKHLTASFYKGKQDYRLQIALPILPNKKTTSKAGMLLTRKNFV